MLGRFICFWGAQGVNPPTSALQRLTPTALPCPELGSASCSATVVRPHLPSSLPLGPPPHTHTPAAFSICNLPTPHATSEGRALQVPGSAVLPCHPHLPTHRPAPSPRNRCSLLPWLLPPIAPSRFLSTHPTTLPLPQPKVQAAASPLPPQPLPVWYKTKVSASGTRGF